MSTKMVSVTFSDKNNDFKKRPQILSREYVNRFNLHAELTGKEYLINEAATKTYYATREGTTQAASELQESVNSDSTDNIVKSVAEARKLLKKKK